MNTDNENIVRAVAALRVIEDFLLAHKCPPGVRPIVLEKLADILAYNGKPQVFNMPITHRVDRAKITIFMGCHADALDFASRHGGKVKTNLRLI